MRGAAQEISALLIARARSRKDRCPRLSQAAQALRSSSFAVRWPSARRPSSAAVRKSWRGNQQVVARVAERSKDVGIRFARAGCENYVLDINIIAAIRIVSGNRPACGFQPLRIGLVR